MRKPWVAGAVLLILLVVGFLLHRASRQRTLPVPELVAQLPPDADWVGYADLAAARRSAFLAKLGSAYAYPGQDPEYAEFVRATGFDYERDLDRVAVALGTRQSLPFTFVLAEGRWNRERIAAYALRHGERVTTSGPETYVLSKDPSGGFVFLKFLSRERIALGHSRGLAHQASSAGERQAWFREPVSRVAGSAILLVGRSPDWPPYLRAAGIRSAQLETLLRGIEWFSVALQPREDGLLVFLDAACDTQERAKEVAGAVDGLRMLVRAALGDASIRRRISPDAWILVESVLEHGETTYQANRVRLRIELKEETLTKQSGAEGKR